MAAGEGFKTFSTGDVLTAADVNGYLMQGVWVFTNAANRTAEVTSPQEGNVSFLKDTNSLEIYDGAAWVAYGAGDITGVTAGTGISGGGTSGTVTITNSMATAIDAKGDLIVGTGADTFDRLAVGGTNGHVLTVDSSTSTGLKWAAAAAGGGGKILQVVQGTTTTSTTISSSTLTDTTITASITPSATTSKILVLVDAQNYIIRSGGTSTFTGWALLRGSTNIYDRSNEGFMAITASGATAVELVTNAQIIYLDSPSTTSSTTYKVQARAISGSMTLQRNSVPSSITLLEVGA